MTLFATRTGIARMEGAAPETDAFRKDGHRRDALGLRHLLQLGNEGLGQSDGGALVLDRVSEVSEERHRMHVVVGHACILALALAGCKTSHVLDVASHTDAATAAQTDTHEVKQAGPEIIALSVDEYAALCPGPSSPDGSDPRASAVHELGGIAKLAPGGLSAAPHPVVAGSLTQGPLLRHVEAIIYRGPSLDDLRTISSLQSKLNQTTEIKTKDLREFLSGLWPWLLGAFGAAALALLKPSWLGAALGALKSLFGRKAS